MIAAQEVFENESENSRFNQYFDATNKKMGIITTGIAFNYLSENYPDGFEYPVLKITQYPAPVNKIQKLFDECDEILVLEEGYPVLEAQLKGILNGGKTIHGRLGRNFQRDGELTPECRRQGFGKRNHTILCNSGSC